LKVPEFRLFTREEFPDQPWIEKLLRPLNATLGQTIAGLRNGLTFGENLNAEVKQLDVTTNSEWLPLALTAPWTAGVRAPQHRKRARRVEMRGTLTRNAAAAGSVALTLPLAAQPAQAAAHLPLAADSVAPALIVLGAPSADAAQVWFTGTPTVVHLDAAAYDAADATGGANGCFPVKFKTNVRGKVAGLLLLRCVELDQRNEKIAPGIGSPAWEQDGESIILRDVPGLAGSKTYRLTLAVVGG
jgi:hypothetical protein